MLSRFSAGMMLLICISLPVNTQAQDQSAYRWVDKDGRVHYSDQPPMPAEASKSEHRRFVSGTTDDVSAEAISMKRALRDFPLTLYTAPTCKEGCQLAREFLGQRNIPYSEKTIQTREDLDGFRNYTGLTDPIVPLLLAGGIGGKVEKGFEANAWRKFLEASGYPGKSAGASKSTLGSSTPKPSDAR